MGALIMQGVVNYFLSVATGAWALMLMAGAAHINWWPQMPLMGYNDAFGIVLAGSLPVVLFALIVWMFILLVASVR